VSSNPKLRKLRDWVRAHHGGEETLLSQLRSGRNCVLLTRDIRAALEAAGADLSTIACSDDSVRLLLKKFDLGKYQAALKEGATALMDETLVIADDVAESKDAVAKAKLRIDVRTNLASKLDRATWGDTPAGPAVQITLGNQFLAAVLKPNALPPPPAKALPPTVDADVEEESEATTAAYARTDAEKRRAARVTAMIKEYGLTLREAEARVASLEHGEQRPAVLDQLPRGITVKKTAAEEDADEL
jgi:hypothetical protein